MRGANTKMNQLKNEFYYLKNIDTDILLHVSSSSIYRITDSSLSEEMRLYFFSEISSKVVYLLFLIRISIKIVRISAIFFALSIKIMV